MSILHTSLADIGRIGVGTIFIFSFIMDFVSKREIFELMKKKNVPQPMICFIGAVTWKLITSIGLVTNIYAYWSALSLALYIFLANLVFNNFWAVPAKQRNFSIAMFLIHLASCFGLLAIAATC